MIELGRAHTESDVDHGCGQLGALPQHVRVEDEILVDIQGTLAAVTDQRELALVGQQGAGDQRDRLEEASVRRGRLQPELLELLRDILRRALVTGRPRLAAVQLVRGQEAHVLLDTSRLDTQVIPEAAAIAARAGDAQGDPGRHQPCRDPRHGSSRNRRRL